LHSSDYRHSYDWGGLDGVVVGSANTGMTVLSSADTHGTKAFSGHDVADDMLNAGLASVTMVQRGRTCTGNILRGLYHALTS
jgi:cation diffusion facilitator CzcD-associated flavoprotein CzcO